MRNNINDIVHSIVNSIDKTIEIDIVLNGKSLITTLYLCRFKWLVVGSIVEDLQGNKAKVTEIGTNFIVIDKTDFIEDIENPYNWTSKKLIIDKTIYYFSGTALSVNPEWNKFNGNDIRNKVPFVWLLKPTNERNNENFQGIKRISSLRLFFLNETNIKYKEIEHNEKVLKPLWEWVVAFFEAIKKNKDFANVDYYDSRELSRFGSETAQGFEANIIEANLSAIEVIFDLLIRDGAKCLCNDFIIDTGNYLFTGENYVKVDNENLVIFE